jgi:hypothetical protein
MSSIERQSSPETQHDQSVEALNKIQPGEYDATEEQTKFNRKPRESSACCMVSYRKFCLAEYEAEFINFHEEKCD